MAEWTYDQKDWARTRKVQVGQDPDGKWRWWRTRTGPEQRVVSSCVSGGFDDAKWMYRNAVKENVGLEVPVPEGVEPLTVIEAEGAEAAPEEDTDEVEATTPVEPEPPTA